MFGSRRRHASTTRKDVPAPWPAAANPRTTADAGATAGNDRSRRPSNADQPHATLHSTANSSQFPMAAAAVSSSSRLRSQDMGPDAYDLRTYLKRKTTDRRSPRSSEEKLYAPEIARQSRSGAYTRSGYPTTSSAPQGIAQSYHTSNAQPSREPVIPQRDRDREKAEARERKRSEKEAARARIEEEKSRVRAYERERERERERRLEEKARQRARLKEEERRKDEKEQDRLRRHREKERARESSRQRDINQVYPHHSASAQIAAAAGALKQYAESKLSSRHHQTDQIPSSSSNLALPQYGTQPGSSSARHQQSAEVRKDDSSQMFSPQVPAKDKKRYRSYRDRTAAQQSAQESGLSSSEQEHSGKERPPRATERRHTAREPYDTHYSGPSGSENERNPRERVRKISRTHGEGHGGSDPSRPGTASQVHGFVQPSAPVGSTSFQHYVPQIVSIRAGQGPADPSTPQSRSKTLLASVQSRLRDAQPPVHSSTPAQVHSTNATHSYSSQPPPYTQQQQSRHPSTQPPQDNVYRLHNVLGTSSQAPLPPLPPDASQYYPSAEQSTNRPTYTPPFTQLPQPTITPRSMAPSLPKDPPLGRSHTMPSSADSRQLPPKATSGYSPGKTQDSNPSLQPTTQFPNFSMYSTHGTAVSAEITLPTGTTSLPDGSTQFVTVTQTSVKDLAARFPLNEDGLTSASSSTLAGNSAPSNQQAAPSYTPPRTRKGSVEQPRPSRNSVADSMLPPNWVPTPASQSKPLGERQGYNENEVPIPVPGPRTTASAQAAANYYQGMQASDSRSQKQNLPSLPGNIASPQTLRPQPLQLRGPGTYGPPDLASAPLRSANTLTTQATVGLQTTPTFPPNHSPARSTQQTIKGSPASGNNGIQLAGATPKHSPSQRLPGRNGSTDTVQLAPPVKSSPGYTTKSVPPNPISTQQAYVSSRTDMNSTRPTNVSLEYPDNGRYRSQTPAYPSSAPPQQSTYLPSQTSIPNVQPQHMNNHHARSMSNPVNPIPPPEPYVPPTRSNTIPQPSMSTVAATAPSASAVIAAYRNRDHNGDSQSRYQDSANQRVPPRTAPSPAPTNTGRPYPAPPASRSGFPIPNGSSQPPRGQPPAVQRPPGGPPPTTSGTHSRAQSDPQFLQPLARVPVAGHMSTPAGAQLTLHPTPSELDLLKTPSSIAPSMPRLSGPPVRPPSAQASKPPKTNSKKGIFGLFRSRSSPPKQDPRAPSDQPSATPAAQSTKTRKRSTSQGTITSVAASVRNIIAPHPAPQQSSRAPPPVRAASAAPPAPPPTAPTAIDQERRELPPSKYPPSVIIPPAPTRTRARENDGPITGSKYEPGSKMVSSFRLVSKHYRTVSSASVEAVDGTVANTVIGGESARSSTAGRLSPPLRDPRTATQEWRNREEDNYRDRGTWRRRRPGVVFDVREEFTDTETHMPAKKSRSDRRPGTVFDLVEEFAEAEAHAPVRKTSRSERR